MLFKVERRPHSNRPLFARCRCCGRYRHIKYHVKKMRYTFKWIKGDKAKKVPVVAKWSFACCRRCADALTLQML